MCTAIRFNSRYFGRTLDFERSFGEEMVVTPRGVMPIMESRNRYAMMGVGVVMNGTPMYFDGVNEWGLAAAALNFPGCAVYKSDSDSETGIPSAFLISHILGLCHSIREAVDMLNKVVITDREVDGISPSPLHWILADGRESVVIESVESGIHIYDNPIGVLTNSPELPYHLTRMQDYASLGVRNPERDMYSRGMGAVGLPGDFSSVSRFARAAFLRKNCFDRADNTRGELHRAFSLLNNLSVPIGAMITDEGKAAYTMYSVVVDMERPGYYLTTATCSAISHIALTDKFSNGSEIQSYPIYREDKFIPLAEK
jgi:choloylglycine hydrolase